MLPKARLQLRRRLSLKRTQSLFEPSVRFLDEIEGIAIARKACLDTLQGEPQIAAKDLASRFIVSRASTRETFSEPGVVAAWLLLDYRTIVFEGGLHLGFLAVRRGHLGGTATSVAAGRSNILAAPAA